MATVNQTLGTRTNLGSIGTLANATYLNVGTITFDTANNPDVMLEVSATPGTVSGNKQLLVFAQKSLDGTNFETGPVSGTTTTDESLLTLIGAVPLPTNSTIQRKTFSLAMAFGTLPFAAKIIVKNDSGAALASGSVEYSEVVTTVA